MLGRKLSWLVLIMVGLVWRPGNATARRPLDPPVAPSYVEVDPPANSTQMKALLAERLRQVQGMSETEKLLQQLLSDPAAAEWLQQAKGLPPVDDETIQQWKRRYAQHGLRGTPYIDPKLKELLQHAIKDPKLPKQLHIPEQDKPQIAEAIQKLPTPPQRSEGSSDSSSLPQIFSGPKGKALQQSGDMGLPPSTFGPQPDINGDTPVTPPSDNASESLARWLLDQSRHLREMDGTLRDSAAVKQTIANLDHYLSGGPAWSHGPAASRFTDQFRDLFARLPKQSLWNGGSLPHLPKFSWNSLPKPSVPHIHGPNVHMPAVHMPGFHAPSFGGVSAPGAATGQGLLWVIVIVACVLLAWWTIRQGGPASWLTGVGGRHLGPWPVDPHAVETREQLILAFEYLTLLRLGPAARMWNHWQIAAELGILNDTSSTAALQLALVYEHARYQPRHEALSPDAMRAARQSLVYLAGVTHA